MPNNNEKEQNKEILITLEQDIQKILSEVETHVTKEGLIPELYERKKVQIVEGKEVFGFNSEMLGYSMRLAVENEDKKLFEQLHNGYRLLREKGNNNLLRARLNYDLSLDNEGNHVESWADGNQDVALALLDAGDKWDPKYKEEGITLAKSFLTSDHIFEIDNNVYVFNSIGEIQSQHFMEQLLTVDMSMWNFNLYERMQQLDPKEPRWGKLTATGIKILTETLSKFKLPPNRIPIMNGHPVTYTELIQTLGENAELLNSLKEIGPKLMERLQDPIMEQRLYGWDSIRTSYRLTDTSNPKLLDLAVTIYKRLEKIGIMGVNIQSETGNTEIAASYSASMAPLLKAQICAQGEFSPALKRLEDLILKEQRSESNGTFKTPLYWKLWNGLGLSQIKGALT
jgi:hypothetical protein